MKRILGIIVTLLLIAVIGTTLCSCVSGDIYDDDSKILRNADSRTAKLMTTTNQNGQYALKAKSFTGISTLSKSFDVTDGTTLDVDMTVKSGRMKVVLTSDDKVYTIAEGECHETVSLSSIPFGTYRLKVVGASAELELNVKYK